MGCFLGCFGKHKDQKHRRRIKKSLPHNHVNPSFQPLQTSPSPQKPAEKVADVISALELSPCRKKVTFDLNVNTYEGNKDSLVDEVLKEVREEKEEKVGPDSNYRYQNCESSDEEEEYEVDGEFDDEDEDSEDGIEGIEEESYDSYFSIPVDNEKNKQTCQEVDSPMPTTTSARDRSQYVHPVLNPVENLSQWKEVKARVGPLKNLNKEHINIELGSNVKIPNKENNLDIETKVTGLSYKAQKPIDSNSTLNNSMKQEISVDASLSTWLVSSEAQGSNSHWSNSSVSREEQPILGALTVEDLKHSSVTSSPRRSPSRNPDEIPILGTVGSYWN